MLTKYIGPVVEELANLYSGISVVHPIEAEAVLSGSKRLQTERGVNITLEDGRAILTSSSPDDGVVLNVKLVSDSKDVYVHTPIVELEGPGIVAANAIPSISNGGISGGTVDRSGGLYSAERLLVTEIGQPILTEQTGQRIIVGDPSRLREIPITTENNNKDILSELNQRILTEQDKKILTDDPNLKILTEMGFKILDERSGLTIPITVTGDGTGAVVNGIGNFDGKITSIEVVSAGSGYTHASFEFPKPVRNIPPAIVKPIIVGNRIVSFEVEFGSWNYLFQPRVTITDAGLGFRTNVTTAFDHLVPWNNVLHLPSVCVYGGKFYKSKINAEPDLIRVNVRLYGNPSLSEMDDFIEDIDILTNIYYKKTSLPVVDSKITKISSFTDYWFPRFTLCDLVADILVSKDG